MQANPCADTIDRSFPDTTEPSHVPARIPARPLRPRRQLPAPASTCSRPASRSAKGEITPEQLRAVEDKAITEIVKFQEDVGLKSITDGEFRRTYFHIDFLEQLGGVKTDIPVTIRKPDGTEELAPPVMRVIDKVRHVKDIQLRRLRVPEEPGVGRQHAEGDDPLAHDAALPRRPRRHQPRALPRARPGVLRRRRQGLRRRAALARRGRLHLRADGRHQPRLPLRREDARGGAPARRRPERAAAPLRRLHQQGGGAEARRHDARRCTCAAATSRARMRRPATTSRWPRRCSTEMDLDAYFLEYDDDRSGDFRPLRFLPKGKTVVLGLVTTKFGEMEDKDELKRRIDEAAQVRAARPARAVAAVRLLQHGARQQHRRRGAARQAAAGGGDGAGGLGLIRSPHTSSR